MQLSDLSPRDSGSQENQTSISHNSYGMVWSLGFWPLRNTNRVPGPFSLEFAI